MLDAHQMGRRLLLRVPDRDGKGYHKDPRDIVAVHETDDGGTEAAVWDGDGQMVRASALEADGIEILGIMDAGEETVRERIRGVGKKVGGAALGAVS